MLSTPLALTALLGGGVDGATPAVFDGLAEELGLVPVLEPPPQAAATSPVAPIALLVPRSRRLLNAIH
jgi:hypothetical protein